MVTNASTSSTNDESIKKANETAHSHSHNKASSTPIQESPNNNKTNKIDYNITATDPVKWFDAFDLKGGNVFRQADLAGFSSVTSLVLNDDQLILYDKNTANLKFYHLDVRRVVHLAK